MPNILTLILIYFKKMLYFKIKLNYQDMYKIKGKILFFFICFFNNVFALNKEVFEDNEIAATLCRGIEIIHFFTIPTGVIILTTLGVGALNGKFKWQSFVFFAAGIGLFKSSEILIDFAMPGIGMKYGCRCKEFHIAGYDNSNKPIIEYLNLKPDCTKKNTQNGLLN